MKKTTLLLSALMLATSLVFAQPLHIKWAPVSEDIWPLWKIIGSDTGGYYVYRNKAKIEAYQNVTNGSCIEKRGFDNKIIFSKEYDLKKEGTNYFFIKTIMLKNGPIIIVYDWTSKTYYGYSLSNDGTLTNKSLLITDNDVPKALLGHDVATATQATEYATHFVASADKSTLLSYHVNKKDNSTLTIQLYGDDLKLMWSANMAANLTKSTFIADALTDGKKAYLLIVDANGNMGKSLAFRLYMAGKSGATDKIDISPNTENACIISLGARITSDGQMLIAGMTCTIKPDSKFKDRGATGYCYLHVDLSSGKVTVNTAENFDKDFMLKYLTEKQIDKGKGIENLGFKDVVENADKSIILFAEQGKSTSRSVNSYSPNPAAQAGNPAAPAGTFRSESMLLFEADDIIVVKLNPNGSKAWVADIPKIQKVDLSGKYFDYVGSYGYWLEGDKIYLIYNDSKKNEKLDADKMGNGDIATTDLSPSSSALMLETVNLSDGALKRKAFNDQYSETQEHNKTMIYSSMAKKMGDIILLYRSDIRSKKEQFGSINIADITDK